MNAIAWVRASHWYAPWLVFFLLGVLFGPLIYFWGYRDAEVENEIRESCDHHGGRLTSDSKRCVTEVEIPISELPK